jgi:replicative DNA helicase
MDAKQDNGNVARLREEERLVFRQPPHNLEAEQALLGAVLVNNLAYNRVSDFLRPEHFVDPLHGRIYDAMSRLIERNQIASPVTLKPYFEQDEGLMQAGGFVYLARLATQSAGIINAADYARLVHDLYLRRELIDIGEQTVNGAFQAEVDQTATDQIEIAEKRLFDLAQTGQVEGGFIPFQRAVTEAISMAEAAFKREGKLTGVATGLYPLDRLLGGLHKSDLIILAGRPGMGKTALATNIAFHVANSYTEGVDENGQRAVVDGGNVGFFSLEMSSEQLATRVLAEQAEVSSEKIRRGELNAQDFHNVVETSARLERIPLFIDDTPALTIAALRTRARRLMRQHGLQMLVVDYLQLLQPSGNSRQENRVQEISEITRGLKTLAKELNVPVLALSQLSRAVEQREDKRPQLSDLRESGSIEQDADVVMFVYREEYYHKQRPPQQRDDEPMDKFHDRMDKWMQHGEEIYGQAEAIVAKQRHGPTGSVKLKFDGPTTRFSSPEGDEQLPQPQ